MSDMPERPPVQDHQPDGRLFRGVDHHRQGEDDSETIIEPPTAGQAYRTTSGRDHATASKRDYHELAAEDLRPKHIDGSAAYQAAFGVRPNNVTASRPTAPSYPDSSATIRRRVTVPESTGNNPGASGLRPQPPSRPSHDGGKVSLATRRERELDDLSLREANREAVKKYRQRKKEEEAALVDSVNKVKDQVKRLEDRIDEIKRQQAEIHDDNSKAIALERMELKQLRDLKRRMIRAYSANDDQESAC
eukprot:scaffold663401_cov37-Prasinocladus_malaysianus.AAC.1